MARLTKLTAGSMLLAVVDCHLAQTSGDLVAPAAASRLTATLIALTMLATLPHCAVPLGCKLRVDVRHDWLSECGRLPSNC